MMRVGVRGIGLVAPGIPNWEAGRPVLAGTAPHVPGPFVHSVPDLLPAAERRRAGAMIRLAIAVAQQAVRDAGERASELATVFASSDSDGENMHLICEALASGNPEISPTRFHNSVQNAAAGYWSIATGSRAPSNTVNGFDGIFAIALLESCAQVITEERDVLLVACELPMPEPLFSLHPLPAPCGVALYLSAGDRAGGLASLEVVLERSGGQRATACADPGLEGLRAGNPAARALPVLTAIARESSTLLRLDADGGMSVRAQVDAPPR